MVGTVRPGMLVEPWSGRFWTPDETARRIGDRVLEYRRRKVQRGDRVFLHFGNCNEFFVELLAAWQVGACVVPIDTNLTQFEIETLADWGKPRLSVWNGEVEPATGAALERLGVANLDCLATDVASPAPPGDATLGIRLDDDALILFTSGTTGQPKGVVHTHRSLLARWTSLRERLGINAFSRTLCLLPTHFGHGLICNSLFPWLSGCDLHILPPFRPELVAALGQIVDEHRITFMSSVPTVWRLAQRVAAAPESGSLVRVFVGSAPLSRALWESVREWTGTPEVFNAYGITETGSWLAGTSVGAFTPEDGLVGEAWGGVIRLTSTDDAPPSFDDGSVRRVGESGHVWVRTPALMRGYLDRDDLTEKVVVDGWFLTGDLGRIDERGWLYLHGRERDEINKGGMKVHPADIDAVLERFPAARDVCTFAFPEEFLGEDVGVAVVLEGMDAATLVELFDWAAKHLAKHQLPQRWYVLDELPRSSRGKVSRQAVADRCATDPPVSFARLRSDAAPDDRE
jgi:acyl-CoA synthetase (AMP-forming)/AMP-acid ligase II